MNLQLLLLQFCEPFMDAQYSKVGLFEVPSILCSLLNQSSYQMDRIDPAYYAHSSRIDTNDETRINATNPEAEEWKKQNEATSGECLRPHCQHLLPAADLAI